MLEPVWKSAVTAFQSVGQLTARLMCLQGLITTGMLAVVFVQVVSNRANAQRPRHRQNCHTYAKHQDLYVVCPLASGGGRRAAIRRPAKVGLQADQRALGDS